nr:glycine cleavage T C-terminal barrel domain-containing protein [Sneathiella glossodoripedis]
MQFKLKDPTIMLYHNEPIIRNGEYTGYISSGAYGHAIGSCLGMGYVRAGSLANEDLLSSRYEIEVAGKRVEAIASLMPFYDPKSTRIRS